MKRNKLTVFILIALALGNPIVRILDSYHQGLWMLLPFTMQMTLIIVLSAAVAVTPFFRRAIAALARLCIRPPPPLRCLLRPAKEGGDEWHRCLRDFAPGAFFVVRALVGSNPEGVRGWSRWKRSSSASGSRR